MSSVNKTKYKLVLYQSGLGTAHDYYNDTFEKIIKNDSSSLMYSEKNKTYKNTFIDMTEYDCEKGYFYGLNSNGYKGRSTELTNKFNNLIQDIVNTMINNPTKIVHVKTQLNDSFDFADGFDTIENQKIKLMKIINSFKSYNLNLEIYLVGHSQGGLVNLETAIEMPTDIKKMISISTPYSPVSVAKNLLYIDRLIKKAKLGGLLVGDSEEETARYENCANTLTSKDYFKNLKKKWDNLAKRPKLLVITGTSGFVTKTVSEFVTIGVPPFTTSMMMTFDKKHPFDGLVLTCEQKDISYDNIVNITSKSLPCYSEETFVKKICGANIYDRCQGCNLPSFNGFSSIFELACDAIVGNDPMNHDIVDAIFEGAYGVKSTPRNPEYMNYFNIYRSQYSHMFIASCDETVATIMGYLK
ncbi:MAG: hypothetical protein IKC22_07550 [Bacilli bacterium]|nr:hypothetical protein [Bacilli bacterium]MBR2892204.1 hypothetical protein [Bacilli bacterium]